MAPHVLPRGRLGRSFFGLRHVAVVTQGLNLDFGSASLTRERVSLRGNGFLACLRVRRRERRVRAAEHAARRIAAMHRRDLPTSHQGCPTLVRHIVQALKEHPGLLHHHLALAKPQFVRNCETIQSAELTTDAALSL
eukprot:3995175-Prymnesium_polylepis.1